MRVFAQLPITFTGAPHSDPDTSRAAAKAIVPHLERLEQRVLDALAATRSGLTAQELELVTRLSGNTIRPRLIALRARGYVVDSGLTRKTASGRNAVVWRKA